MIELCPGAAARDLEPALEEYRSEGIARLGPVLAGPALAALRARCDELMLGKSQPPGLFFQRDADSGAYDGLPRGKGFQGPSLEYRKIEKLERDPLFLALITNDLFRRIALAVYREPVSLSRAVLFTKSAAGGTQLPWHQDDGTFWGLDRPPVLQIWTALDDAPPESGCVEAIPRSHTAGLATPLGGVVPDDVAARHRAEERVRPFPALAGESMLLHNHVWHRSGRNSTGRPRRAITICYISAATHCRRKTNPRSFVRLFELT